ncbi:hypothetical protein YIM1640_01140 [Thermus oshimai]|uniref:hypothetical protein n=1 Tax=Thermus thermophilus TaxID=274 RepID=UPI0031FA80E1
MVGLRELRAAVERLEQRLEALEDAEAQRLLALYRGILPCLARDLQDERDRLLSQGGALMLIQEVVLDKEGRSWCGSVGPG